MVRLVVVSKDGIGDRKVYVGATAFHHYSDASETGSDYIKMSVFFLKLSFIYTALVPAIGLVSCVLLQLLSLIVKQYRREHLHLYRLRPKFLGLFLFAPAKQNAISGLGAVL